MNIGIMTFHWSTNYGAVLQAFALKTYLEKYLPNANVFVINYYPARYEKKVKNAIRVRSLKILQRSLREVKKDRKINSFRNHLNLTQRYHSVDELRNSGIQYDILIAGSDQVWNQSFTKVGEGKPTPAYFLDFSPKAKKISYAASFGCEELEPAVEKYVQPLLENFSAISVREDTGKAILSNMGFSANVVCDPTLLLGTKEFDNFAEKMTEDPYIASYFVRTQTHETMRFVRDIAAHVDESMKLVAIDNCSVERWVGTIKSASYLITNSYHGVVFACKYHVPFYVFLETGKLKGMNDRFFTLLSCLGLQKRIITDEQKADTIENDIIDWNEIDKRMENMREESGAFLLEHCTLPEKKTIDSLDYSKCTGCGTCANICSLKAISIITDANGFDHPAIDHNKCVKCGRCLQACPVMCTQTPANDIRVYTFQHSDPQVLRRSSSGGAFYTIASSVIMAGGVVYGAAFKEDFSAVEHKMARDLNELNDLLESKYIPSRVYHCFPIVKRQLDEGQNILFSGTPCQISGLKHYLGKDYHNLISLAVECHGVPSLSVWHCYKRELEQKYKSSLTEFHFRDKTNGWIGYSVKAKFKNGKVYMINHHEDTYMKCYLNHLSMRDSCFVCPINVRSCGADIILADAWNEAKDGNQYIISNGVSKITVCTDTGREIIDSLKTMKIQKVQTMYSTRADLSMPNGRKQFLLAVNGEGTSLIKLVKTYIKEPFVLKAKKRIKRMIKNR